MAKLTPMMEQYFLIKEQHPDAILFFRLGDFYEMFFEDAKEASKILEIALTGRSCGLEEKAPMCGIPFHSCDSYIQKLIQAGKKVAICEQMEDPKETKGLVKREVTKIITPGTFIDESVIQSFRNNYILSVYLSNDHKEFALAYVDVSTGDLNVSKVSYFDFADIFYKISPSELIGNSVFINFLNGKEKLARQIRLFVQNHHVCVNASELISKEVEIEFFSEEYLRTQYLLEQQNTDVRLSIRILLSYIQYTQKTVANNLNSIHWIYQDKYLHLDYSSISNLELMESFLQKNKKYSLFGVLDKTKTSMGARMLRKWIEHPLRDKKEIEQRLDIVEECISDYSLREDLREYLDSVYDMERICAKISYDTVTVRDLLNLKESLYDLPNLREKIELSDKKLLIQIFEQMDTLEDIYHLLDDSISDRPIGTIKDGEVIREGYSKELDEMRSIEKNAASILSQMELQERASTGFKTLKIGYNKVFGYYIEITHAALKSGELPESYVRKQTLANCERYINQELKELEIKILTSRQRALDLQNELYAEVKTQVKHAVFRIQTTADKIGSLDALLSLAETSYQNDYVKPSINKEKRLEIADGRHPVVERLVEEQIFVPNDTNLLKDKNFMIITGPNMGGKSTYMRQVALICIMAHIGCYIPAKFGDIPLLDAIYTRVGAADDLSQGQSTFMVEMNEVSHILEHATEHSLVILDEVGRGTSTYDGMSIAWAIVAFICRKIQCMTLFSTHYHEITDIAERFDNVVNYCVAVEEKKEEVLFLRKLVQGKADKSYGIHVAKLAHLPKEVLSLAEHKLNQLQSQKQEWSREIGEDVFVEESKESDIKNSKHREIINELEGINTDTLTPLEALLVIHKIKEKLLK